MFISVNDKGRGSLRSNYLCEGWGLIISFFQVVDGEDSGSFIDGWSLSNVDTTYTGDDFNSLLETILNIKKEKGLKFYYKDGKQYKKDILVIYTNMFFEVSAFMINLDSSDFKYYTTIFDNIEFRACWNNKLKTSSDIAKWANDFITNLFIPDKYFYLTPSQVFRKKIARICKKNNITLGPDIFPDTPSEYEDVRQAFFGGLCICDKPGEIAYDVIEYDIKSGYPFAYFMKMPVSASKIVSPIKWREYITSNDKTSIGLYRLKKVKNIEWLNCFKDTVGKDLKDGSIIRLSTPDLVLIMNISNLTYDDIECLELQEYDFDYLPREILMAIAEAFINKEQNKGSVLYDVFKVMLNSIYGNSSRQVHDTWEYKERAEDDLTILWGIYITAYCRCMVYMLRSNLYYPLYSDTDSVYCKDTQQNAEVVRQFNELTRSMLKEACSARDIDFDSISTLGIFEVEDTCQKFKAFKQKQYVYVDSKGDMKCKAAGCNKESMLLNESLFDRIPVGVRVADKWVYVGYRETVRNGKTYKSCCGPYIIRLGDMTYKGYMVLKNLMCPDERNY